MKQVITTILLATLTVSATAQRADSTIVSQSSHNQSKNDTVIVFSHPTTSPAYRGGKAALTKFLNKNVTYPELAAQYGVEGRVVMTFVVDYDGTLKDIAAKDCKIERFNATKFGQESEAKQKELKVQFAKLFAKEGARVIRMMPRWAPGKQDGQTIRVKYSLPIRFADPRR